MDEPVARSLGADLGGAIDAALATHRAGDLARAATLYEDVLASDPSNARALYLFGLLHQQNGDHSRAEELIGRSAGIRPGIAAVQASWAESAIAVGLHERAADRARAALRLGPDDPKVRHILGLALQALGRGEEAVEELRNAVRLRPEYAAAWNDLGHALSALDRRDEARAAFLDATRIEPGLAVAHANLGLLSRREGRRDEARRHFQRAAGLDPARPFSWQHLAEIAAELEEFDAAIPCWERVLALTPEPKADLHLDLGRAYHEEHRFEEAAEHFGRAVAIEPGSTVPRINLGLVCAERGHFAEAEEAFRAAIRLRPDDAPGHVHLATLLGGALPDADLEALSARVDDPAIGPNPRARLLFALGHVLDARGERGRAAGCLREANALDLARGNRPFRPDAYERAIDELIDAFGPPFFDRVAGAGLDSRRPVFLVGLPRSGTTLLEQILAGHPRVHGAGELTLAAKAFDVLTGIPGRKAPASSKDVVPFVGPDTIRRLARSYLDRLQAMANDEAERIVDKLPENYLYLGLITALFPEATVIHCRRDLRDVALSCWMVDFDKIAWANDPGHIAVTFRAYLRLMEHWRAVLPTPIHEVDYEETVADLEGVARRLYSALGLDWHPACLEFHRAGRPVRTRSVTQVRQPIHRRSVGRWKLYERELADLFAALPPQDEASARAGRRRGA